MANRLFEKFRQAFEPKVSLPRAAKPEFELEHTRYQMPEPELYSRALERARPTLKRWLRMAPQALRRSLSRSRSR